MPLSPRRPWLYRSRASTVISIAWLFLFSLCLVVTSLEAQGPLVQYGRRTKVDNGPRAVGLVQLPEKGKPRLIPIAIMVDGKFYDADSYKAAPVPMAVDFGIVYEAFHAGVSQGVFTITQPGQMNKTWLAEGKWLPASMRAAAEKKKKFTAPVIEDENGPPVLHRRKPAESDSKGGDKDKDGSENKEGRENKEDKDKNKDKNKAADQENQRKEQPTKDATADPKDKSASNDKKSAESKQTSESKSADATSSSSASSDDTNGDPNRPWLRRGAPTDPSIRRDVYAKFEALPAPVAKPSGDQKISGVSELRQVTTYPAVSDAGGPDPVSYIYDIKPSEEETYRAKMLEVAGVQLRAQLTGKEAPKAKDTKDSSKKSAAGKTIPKASKLPKIEFDDVSLRFFDLSNSNEPVLVLSAKARVMAAGSTDTVEPKDVTLVARTNLEGEVKKLFFSQTDTRHLDETPRMEIVDAVDADGDGRGELLFRRIYENGSAYGIYRVTSDKLWPLFEGNP